MTTTLPNSFPALEACPPRFGTPRNYSRETLGGDVAAFAEKLGTPLMPWQRHVVDVAMEIDPNTGYLYYHEIDLTVPRQSGKTALILALAVHRALAPNTGQWADGPQNIVYTAQTRNDARKKWEDDHVVALEKSIFKRMFDVRKTNGSEAIKWRNGSKHGLTASTEKSGHGSTLDLGFVDEAFAQTDTRQEQAMKPAMITRRGSQLWVVSTAGTPDSTYLRGKVDRGRARVLAGQASRVAYFEWSLPDEADPSDRGKWWECMPALGHTQPIEAIEAEFDGMEIDDFARAFLNQWRDGKAPARVISENDWTLCEDETSQLANPTTDPIVLGIDVTPNHAFAALAMAGIRSDDLEHVEVLNHKPGIDWVVDRVVEIMSRRNVVAVTLDPAGPAGALVPYFEAREIELVKINARDMAQACGGFYTACVPPDEPSELSLGKVSRTLRHRGQASLNAALGAALKRPLGDAWAWSRKTAGDICPLVAVTIARYVLTSHIPEQAPLSDDDLLKTFF
uniref:Phage Terminase n=1 Tax=uncultured organism TaxID=155900 RepID=A0A7L9QCK5_9ZZZZ|nr:hypothetical protein [uncultured organism]